MNEFVNELVKEFFLTNPFYWIFIIIGILCAVFYKRIVGKAGEFHVYNELKKLPSSDYLIINDLMISVHGVTHQIDHVVVSKYGIFVIETKQWHGFITGSFYDEKWTMHYGSDNSYSVSNPIKQNYGHILSLSELLGVDKSKLINIVCFPSDVTLKLYNCFNVVGLDDLNNKIISYNAIRIDEVKNIYDKLVSSNITDKNIRKEHIKNCKDKH